MYEDIEDKQPLKEEDGCLFYVAIGLGNKGGKKCFLVYKVQINTLHAQIYTIYVVLKLNRNVSKKALTGVIMKK